MTWPPKVVPRCRIVMAPANLSSCHETRRGQGLDRAGFVLVCVLGQMMIRLMGPTGSVVVPSRRKARTRNQYIFPGVRPSMVTRALPEVIDDQLCWSPLH